MAIRQFNNGESGLDIRTILNEMIVKLMSQNMSFGSTYQNYSDMITATNEPNTLLYVINPQGTQWLPGNLGGTYFPNGFYYYDGTNYTFQTSPFNATLATINTGVNDTQFVTPYGFANANKWLAKQNTINVVQYTLLASNWVANSQTITVTGVTEANNIMVSPEKTRDNYLAYGNAFINCTQQSNNALTFTCTTTPTVDLTINVAIL